MGRRRPRRRNPRDNPAVPISDDTFAWRRDLPHLQKQGQTFFVTFCTRNRQPMGAEARDAVLQTCVTGHRRHYWLHAVVVMPDHVHLIFTLYEHLGLSSAIQQIKSVSAHRIGGRVWQREFDRVMRSDEDLYRKGEYLCANPVRAGLVERLDDYRWIWRSWIEGENAPARAPAPH